MRRSPRDPRCPGQGAAHALDHKKEKLSSRPNGRIANRLRTCCGCGRNNRFAWDLRVEDPREIPGAFYAGEGPRGPVVNPGSYVVRLTTRSAVQSVPMEVVPDPRLKDTVTAGDLAATGIDDTDDAGYRCAAPSVNQMRTMRRNLETLKAWAGARPAARPWWGAADFDKHMAPIEEQLIQVNMKASEDNLRYPNRLNEQYDTFIATVDADDVLRPWRSRSIHRPASTPGRAAREVEVAREH